MVTLEKGVHTKEERPASPWPQAWRGLSLSPPGLGEAADVVPIAAPPKVFPKCPVLEFDKHQGKMSRAVYETSRSHCVEALLQKYVTQDLQEFHHMRDRTHVRTVRINARSS